MILKYYMLHLFIYIKIYQSIAIIISFYLILKKTNDRIKPKKWWKKHKKMVCMVN
jgi:hypothetical protein